MELRSKFLVSYAPITKSSVLIFALSFCYIFHLKLFEHALGWVIVTQMTETGKHVPHRRHAKAKRGLERCSAQSSWSFMLLYHKFCFNFCFVILLQFSSQITELFRP